MNESGKPYRVYSDYLRRKYGQKVYKLPVNIPCTCPNRDGSKGVGGCIFCGASGAGHELLPESLSVTRQLERNRERIEPRYNAHLFIPYYQSFSNTYLAFDRFREYIGQGAAFPDVVELAISTRPDCVEDRQLDYLTGLKARYNIDITIELGLQSSNDRTLDTLNRGHSVGDYVLTASRVKAAGLNLCTHLITDLPWDSKEDVLEAGRLLNRAGSDFVKIHSLYVEKGTELEKMYKAGLKLLGQADFIDRTVGLLETLNPDIVIERLIGRVPEADCVEANWHQSWWKIRDKLEENMAKRHTYQGRLHQNYE